MASGRALRLMLLLSLNFAPGQSFAQEVSPERGERLLKRHCAGCHAVGRKGRSPLRAAPALRDLHLRYEPEMIGEALAEGIMTGHPAMPSFRFGPNDVRSITLYLETIQTRQKSEVRLGERPVE